MVLPTLVSICKCRKEKEESIVENKECQHLSISLSAQVSICACKRVGESNMVLETDTLCPSDFVLGFCTNDQLDAWALYGERVVCLDTSHVGRGLGKKI